MIIILKIDKEVKKNRAKKNNFSLRDFFSLLCLKQDFRGF